MKKKLDNLSLHLLDLGKRNRLLNYKETGYRTLSFLNKNINDFFIKITSGQKLSLFNLEPIIERYQKTIDGTMMSISEYNNGKVYDIVSPHLKNNELLAYKKGYSLKKIIKTIYKESKNTLLEKGVNTLFLSFGLIKYIDNKQEYLAPLLLIPVSLENDNQNYKIKEYEDEILLNPTFKYLLKTQYKLELKEIDEMDLEYYFKYVKEEISYFNMNLLEHFGIGIYSFLKMNMYEDLTNNSDEVLKNENIIRLLGGNIENKIAGKMQVFPVVNADESQLKSIFSSANGESFVLQGPPGSGKSQTITNIIASAIANDKKVLFVSEKQAALNVVFDNLKRAGLSDFCLELHSHKANKKDFIEELYKTAISPKYDIDDNASEIKNKYDYIYQILFEYREKIHQKIDGFDMTIYELYSKYLKMDKVNFTYQIADIKKYNKNDFDKKIFLLDKYAAIAKLSWKDYRKSPFLGFECFDLSFVKYNAEKLFLELHTFLNKLVSIKNKINSYLPIHINTFYELINSISVVEKIANLRDYHEEYFIKKKRDKYIDIISRYLDNKKFIDETTLFNFLDKKFLEEEVGLILNEFKIKQGFFKFLSPRYHQLKNKINSYSKIKMKDSDLILKLEELVLYQEKTNELEALIKQIPFSINEIKDIYEDLKKLEDFKWDLNFKPLEFVRMKKEFIDILIMFNQVEGLPKYDKYFDNRMFSLIENPLDILYERINIMVNNLEHIENHVNLFNVVKELKNEDLLDYLHLALDNKITTGNFSKTFEKIFLENLIYSLVDEIPILKEIASCNIDNIISEFKKLDELNLEINKAYIISKLSKMRPDDDVINGSEFSTLIKEYNKSRKQKPIRVLLEEITSLILNLKPVFLMSPLSVSTYLNSNSTMFDLVIFDEASQVFSWDALGAVYRAKQCIIIGDSKQMPPSNFFNGIIEDEEIDEEIESILDKGMVVFPTKRLNWHYRSRSEELITFSNEKFYDSRLITIPQAKSKEKGFGIDLYNVKGVYEVKNRVNRIEAEFVVDLIIEHYREKNEQSLGVVAFSSAQAELIEEILEERLDSNLVVEIEKNKDEPFFIKNLETVQGDQRDRIIFSICYGYNHENKFYQRFGPLNNVGGERRLNVAITRSKYNVCVVCSITASDISLNNTNSLGVKLLKEYLSYVEKITEPKHFISENNDGFIGEVAAILKKNRFLIQTNIGTSLFKIDIAVIHPKTKEYIIAIMTDGNSYKIGNCQDSNHLQELLLNRLGWKFYRVFSTKWVLNPDYEKTKLIKYINDIIDETIDEKSIDKTEDFLIENKDELQDKFIDYPLVSDEKIKELYQEKSNPQLIKYIIKKEEPINIDFLLKRICFIYGKTKVTNYVRESFMLDIENLNLIIDGKFLMTKPLNAISFRLNSGRTLEQIHYIELCDAIYSIVLKNNGIEKEGCFKEILRLLGYSRMSENFFEILENVLVLLKLEGKIVEREGRLYY